MYRYAFNKIQKIIPKISNTELIALKSGTTSIDRDIFKGAVKFPEYKNYVTSEETNFLENDVNKLLKKYGEQQTIYPSENYKEVFDYLGKNKFLSFIIKKEYNGLKFSVNGMSSVLTKISSKNPALGVSVMVPNSLGPAELLQKYGTEEQKNHYLPKLSNGEFVPCFGLTGPKNGSDAVGSNIDKGILVKRDGKLYIKVNVNKRYITLAPVSNLVGLAFNLEDPDNLLSNGVEGITVALLEKGQYGLIQNSFHNPLNAGFPNGTLKGSLEIPIEQVIGGEQNVGNGWKMLMECLAEGRGICLPATANASSKIACLGVLNYAKHRKQFNIPLIKMEGVQKKLCNMIYNTWLIDSSIFLTNQLLDSGEKPAVISAIMKEQTTERARTVLNDAMDIHAGSSICLGENNFLEKFYRSAPIGITVEGSNTLTKNLIIFGQGLNKSHPYIFPIFESLINNNLKDFRKNFNAIVGHSLRCYTNCFDFTINEQVKYTLYHQTRAFSCLANFVALKGGEIKRNQYISGSMAQLMSNLYLGHSVIYKNENSNISQYLTDYCLKRLVYENNLLINEIIDNYGSNFIKKILYPLRRKINVVNYDDDRKLMKELYNNPKIMEEISKDCYIDESLNKLLLLDKLLEDGNTEEYNKIYNEIIQVGEFEIDQNREN